MKLRSPAALVLLALAAFVIASMLAGCNWNSRADPVVGVYLPSLKPIPAQALQCLDEQTYLDLVNRELEWRKAFENCKAATDELTVSE